MAVKKATGITPSTVRFGRGIIAVRALPKAKGKRPAVIILHERYGIDQHTKDLTVKLAQTGFVGLAPDLFHRFTGDRKALQKGQARVDLRDDEALEDLNAAVDYLKSSASARPGGNLCCSPRIAMTSREPWCFTVPSAARNGMAMSSGLRPSRNSLHRYLARCWESLARRTISYPWTMWSASVVVWNGRRRVIMCGCTPTRPTAGSTTPCRDATAKSLPRMPGA